MSNESKASTPHRTLRTFFRLFVVFGTWFIVSLVPDSATGFFEAVGIAAITSLYEYCIMLLDSMDGWRKGLAILGMCASAVYVAIAGCGAFGLIMFNVSNLTMSFGNRMPIPNPTHHVWRYYDVIYPMLIFPAIVFIEPWLIKASKAVGKRKSKPTAA